MEWVSDLCRPLVLVWDSEAGQEHLLAMRGLDRVGWRRYCRRSHLWIIAKQERAASRLETDCPENVQSTKHSFSTKSNSPGRGRGI